MGTFLSGYDIGLANIDGVFIGSSCCGPPPPSWSCSTLPELLTRVTRKKRSIEQISIDSVKDEREVIHTRRNVYKRKKTVMITPPHWRISISTEILCLLLLKLFSLRENIN